MFEILKKKQKKQQPRVKTNSNLDGLVGSCDEGNEQRQHHVYEEGDEGVEVDLAEQPHQRAGLLHLGERHKHVVAVDEGEEALGHHGQGAELRDREPASDRGNTRRGDDTETKKRVCSLNVQHDE